MKGIIMSQIQNMHYKQRSPEETVDMLKGILKEMNISVEEEWQPQSSIGTYALRLNFKGTNIGTNGKPNPYYQQWRNNFGPKRKEKDEFDNALVPL